MLNHDTGSLIVHIRDTIDAVHLSPDEKWILYMLHPDPKSPSSTRLMRVPIEGGQPVLALTAKWSPVLSTSPDFGWPFACAKAPAQLCVLAEQSAEGNQLVFNSFDPEKGRGSEIAQFAIDLSGQYAWDLSPNGTAIAILKKSDSKISLLDLNSHNTKEIRVHGSDILDSVVCALHGKELFVSGRVPGGAALLSVDLTGNSRLLWKQDGGLGTYAVPSPDGRHLALSSWTLNSNIWEMEDF